MTTASRLQMKFTGECSVPGPLKVTTTACGKHAFVANQANVAITLLCCKIIKCATGIFRDLNNDFGGTFGQNLMGGVTKTF